MNLLNIAITASVLAGDEILKVYESDDFNVELKDDNSPLTRADKAAHNKIMEVLGQSKIPVLSEEGRTIPYEERQAWDTFWLVDPLDGTKEFIKRNGEFTVNIALIINGKPVMGVIYTPVSGELYYGEINIGAYKAQVSEADFTKPISFKDVHKLPAYATDTLTVVASRSHLSSQTEDIINELKNKHGKVDVVSKGSSLKLCLVAEGSASIYPRLGPTMEWDIAAGQAIAEAAGCTVKRYEDNEPMVYNKENLLNPWFVVERE